MSCFSFLFFPSSIFQSANSSVITYDTLLFTPSTTFSLRFSEFLLIFVTVLMCFLESPLLRRNILPEQSVGEYRHPLRFCFFHGGTTGVLSWLPLSPWSLWSGSSMPSWRSQVFINSKSLSLPLLSSPSLPFLHLLLSSTQSKSREKLGILMQLILRLARERGLGEGRR